MTADSILAELFTEESRANPYPLYRALLEQGPILPLQQGVAGATPFAAIATGYDIIDTVLRDVSYYKKARPDWREHVLTTTFETSMMFSNPPLHNRLRGLFAGTFTPRRLASVDPVITRIVSGLLETMADKGADGGVIDFVDEFAAQLPALLMAEFVGIPLADLDWYRERVRPIDAYLDLNGKTENALDIANDATQQLRDYYLDLIKEKRIHPQEDLLSALVASIDAGEHLMTDPELVSNLIVLFNASFLTTIYMLGSGLPLLLSQPELVAKLPGNEPLAEDCVNEILRVESPVQFLTRAVPADTELGGVQIPKDGVILLILAAANRDPARFAEPDSFDPGRAKQISLTFGAGPHFCVGAAVSRAEGRIALPMLFERFPQLALAGEPVGTGSLFLRGMNSVPITVR